MWIIAIFLILHKVANHEMENSSCVPEKNQLYPVMENVWTVGKGDL